MLTAYHLAYQVPLPSPVTQTASKLLWVSVPEGSINANRYGRDSYKKYLVTTTQINSDSDSSKIETITCTFFSFKLISPNALVTAIIFLLTLLFVCLFVSKYLLPIPSLKLPRDRGLASALEAFLGFVNLGFLLYMSHKYLETEAGSALWVHVRRCVQALRLHSGSYLLFFGFLIAQVIKLNMFLQLCCVSAESCQQMWKATV